MLGQDDQPPRDQLRLIEQRRGTASADVTGFHQPLSRDLETIDPRPLQVSTPSPTSQVSTSEISNSPEDDATQIPMSQMSALRFSRSLLASLPPIIHPLLNHSQLKAPDPCLKSVEDSNNTVKII
uniref:Uncharacterized protein n=1 Tax=Sphaerodactylus townsendi TaxID=933632 RepID=A0ACB8FJU0_9SAUR